MTKKELAYKLGKKNIGKGLGQIPVSDNNSAPVVTANVTDADQAGSTIGRVRQREEDYPNIRWQDKDSEMVQAAILLYDQRVAAYAELKAAIAQYRNQPFNKDAHARITKAEKQWVIAAQELSNYDKTGEYLGISKLTYKLKNK